MNLAIRVQSLGQIVRPVAPPLLCHPAEIIHADYIHTPNTTQTPIHSVIIPHYTPQDWVISQTVHSRCSKQRCLLSSTIKSDIIPEIFAWSTNCFLQEIRLPPITFRGIFTPPVGCGWAFRWSIHSLESFAVLLVKSNSIIHNPHGKPDLI